MIYALVGTDIYKRKQGKPDLDALGVPQMRLYKEDIAKLEPLIDSQSLFGEVLVVELVSLLEKVETKEVVYELLPRMKASPTRFIIDEPFVDAHKVKKLMSYADTLFDCREEKKEGVNPFALCNAFARRDKKVAWQELMKLQGKESPEAVQGALWWKMKTIWGDTLAGKKTGFTQKECEVFASQIIRSVLDAHRGEKDLRNELERIILLV